MFLKLVTGFAKDAQRCRASRKAGSKKVNMPYIPHTPDDLQEMLSVVGVRTLDDHLSPTFRSDMQLSFKLPKGRWLSVCAYFEDLAAKNPEMISLPGRGLLCPPDPQGRGRLAGRSEFLCAYTLPPGECSQGTLQAIFDPDGHQPPAVHGLRQRLDHPTAAPPVRSGHDGRARHPATRAGGRSRNPHLAGHARHLYVQLDLGTEDRAKRQRDGVSDMTR